MVGDGSVCAQSGGDAQGYIGVCDERLVQGNCVLGVVAVIFLGGRGFGWVLYFWFCGMI